MQVEHKDTFSQSTNDTPVISQEISQENCAPDINAPEREKERHRTRRSRAILLAIGIVVVFAAIFTILALSKSPLEKLYDYIQENGEPYDGGYRLVHRENGLNDQTSLIAYGDGSYKFERIYKNSITRDVFHMEVDPNTETADFDVKENVSFYIDRHFRGDTASASGTILKKTYTSGKSVSLKNYSSFYVGESAYFNQTLVTKNTVDIVKATLKNVSTLLDQSGTGVTLNDFGFTSYVVK